MDIYTLLSSKSHNPHYLNRYITFIQQCQQKNIGYEGHTEKHHICPKSMFEEYISFRDHPWNCAVLTPRQHFIAHLLLWKTYRNKKMTRAFGMMSCGMKIRSRLYETIKNEYAILVSEQTSNTVMVRDEDGKSFRIPKEIYDLNDELYGHTKGMTYARDIDGKGHYVSSDDSRFQTGELKGNNSGTITITDGKKNRRIFPDEDIPNGWFRGMTKNSSKNSIWINDGKTSKMFKGEVIPNGWERGRLYNKKPRHVGTTGKMCINDGSTNKMIEKSTLIPNGWSKGRLYLK